MTEHGIKVRGKLEDERTVMENCIEVRGRVAKDEENSTYKSERERVEKDE
jgi:hypothetical protein